MSLSRRNKQGLLGLLVVSLIIAYTPRLISYFSKVERPIISSKEAVILHNEFVQKEKQLFEDNKKKKKKRKNRYKIPKSKFDPNIYNVNDWLALGLSRRQADVVVKFAASGLNSNKELKKIFVIPDELYNLIKDSTVYPASNFEDAEPIKKSYAKYEVPVLNINTASQEELEQLPEIGPFYAKKIIEYRNELGGYNETSQLMEMWKFDVHRFHKLKEYVNVGDGVKKRIDINKASLNELKAHPYIDYSVANSIVKLRIQKGGFKSIEDILESKLIDYPLFDDIKYYIKIE